MTLPAFAAERRRACSCSTALAACPHLSINISCPHGVQKQTRRPPLLLSIDGTDRRTDGRTDARPSHRPYSAYYSGSVNNHAYIETYDQNQWTYSLYGTCSDEVMVQLATPASAPRFLQHVALVHGRVRRLIRGPLAGRLARTTRISSTDGVVA